MPIDQPHIAPWQARLELGFVAQPDRTVLQHRLHRGPLRVQKALWPEDNHVCHAIIVHPPAGIAGGDRLELDVNLAANTHAVLTTPGAGKWYGSDGREAVQHLELNVGENAILEWLPQEVILFDGALVNTRTQIQLHETASFIGWEVLVIGRQSRSEWFNQGHYQGQTFLFQQQQLQQQQRLFADQLIFSGGDRWLQSPLGLNNQPVFGTLWAHPPQVMRHTALLDEQVVLLRELITRMQMPLQVTRLNHLLVARYLGTDARQALDGFAGIRAKLRRIWFNLDEAFPRIWKT